MNKLFKNTAFKCVFVLFIIAVISGGLLAVLNDLLYVSPLNRTSRAITKIYGEEKQYDIVLDIDNGNQPIVYEFGQINKIYTVGNDYLFQTTGYNGYKNGTITVWIQISNSDNVKIEKVILESYEKQTLMSKLGDSFYNGFLIDITDDYDTFFTTSNEGHSNPITGATKSATAGCNAVNCAINYLMEATNEN